MKILVIEDQPAELKLMRHVLSAAGYNVSHANAAEQAAASIAEDRPQVILLDLSLPGMDGLELVRVLKADPRTCEIHIVAVTSYPERFSRTDAMTAGCDAYLLKPLNTRQLPDQVAAVLG